MPTTSATAVIKRPLEEVFPVAADPAVQLKWDSGTLKRVEKLTGGPLSSGSRYRGDFKGYGTVEYEFVEFDPPRRFAHQADMKLGRMRHVFTFEPVAEGTRMTQEGVLRPRGLGRLMGPLMMTMLRRRCRLTAREISEYLEQNRS